MLPPARREHPDSEFPQYASDPRGSPAGGGTNPIAFGLFIGGPGGGAAGATSVPTLSGWAMIALAAGISWHAAGTTERLIRGQRACGTSNLEHSKPQSRLAHGFPAGWCISRNTFLMRIACLGRRAPNLQQTMRGGK